ncbi:MAG TPA: zinc ribbon domain-containing protein [Candidatus Sulfotelmatobacter sp.]|nr:zinc ribbon domain-containing protein [Candidatus Sulfotelmatobacter sp.]
MAFCNSCGATLADGTNFCSKCGKPVTPGAAPSVATATGVPSPPPSTGGGSALKTVLIVIGSIILFGIVCVAVLTFVGLRIARHSHVTQNGDNVKVETPFGSMETSKDPEQAAKDLGVDIYPGAEVQKEGASSATFGGMHTVTASFESSDAADKVCAFYRSKFPNANVSTSDQNRCTIVSNAPPNMVTVNVESSGDASRFQIVAVTKKSQ